MFIHQEPAIFWDGAEQLSGALKLWDNGLRFTFDDFQHSHLNLEIPLSHIKTVKLFMIFKIARKGLKVVSKNDKVDMFILEDSKDFYQKIKLQMEKLVKET